MTGPGPVGGDAGGTHANRHRPPADNPPAEDRPAVDDLEHSTGGSATLPLRGPRSGAPGLEGGPRTVHLIGVGGAGMSGLARLLLAGGHRVTGSDRSESATLEALRALGAEVWARWRRFRNPSAYAGLGAAAVSFITGENPYTDARVLQELGWTAPFDTRTAIRRSVAAF